METKLPKVLEKIEHQNYKSRVKLRYRKQYENSVYRLYLDYNVGGKRINENLKIHITGTKDSYHHDEEKVRIALVLKNKKERQLLEQETGVQISKREKVDFLSFFQDYSNEHRDKNYRRSYERFSEYLGKKSIDIKEIDYQLCEGFKKYLLNLKDERTGEKVKPYTARHYFVTFKATLNYAVRSGLIPQNPANGISINYQKKSIERLTIDELRILYNTECKYPSLKNAFLFACYTGLRVSDLQRLKFSDIINNQTKIIIKKTGIDLELILHPIAQEIIKDQERTKKDNFIFHIPSGGRRSKRLKEWLNAADINPRITWNSSRHTFGCLLIEENTPLFTVSKAMGHTDTKTTLQYVDKADPKTAEAINKLPGKSILSNKLDQ